MANKVIVFKSDREIGWEPGQAGQDGIVEFGGWTWHYRLEEQAGPAQTRVTLSYDWSTVPTELRQHIQFPPFPVEHLNRSLANLANMANLATLAMALRVRIGIARRATPTAVR